MTLLWAFHVALLRDRSPPTQAMPVHRMHARQSLEVLIFQHEFLCNKRVATKACCPQVRRPMHTLIQICEAETELN